MTPIQAIIERFGGASKLARRVGLHRNTVLDWKSGKTDLPLSRALAVLEVGQDLDPPLDPYDFFFLPEPEQKSEAAE